MLIETRLHTPMKSRLLKKVQHYSQPQMMMSYGMITAKSPFLNFYRMLSGITQTMDFVYQTS